MEEPTEILADEVVSALTSADAVPETRLQEARDVVGEFTSFEEGEGGVAPGYERILLKKDTAWLPGKSKSVKAGNLRFNLGKLFESAVGGAGVYFTALIHPIFAVFVGIVALRSLVDAATVELEERDAWVVWAAWTGSQRGELGDAPTILQRLRAEGERLGTDVTMTVEELSARLARLEKIGAVRLEDGEWRVIETVQVRTA